MYYTSRSDVRGGAAYCDASDSCSATEENLVLFLLLSSSSALCTLDFAEVKAIPVKHPARAELLGYATPKNPQFALVCEDLSRGTIRNGVQGTGAVGVRGVHL